MRPRRGSVESLKHSLEETGAPSGVVGISLGEGNRFFANISGRHSTQDPPETNTPFLLTSVTKVFTTAQIHTLCQENRLDIHAPVADVVPEFGAYGKGSVSIFHILTHTSGVDPSKCNGAEKTGGTQNRDFHFAALCNSSLLFRPGSQVQYCSPPFWVLAEVIERITGESYIDDFENRIARKLGLFNTVYRLAGTRGAPEVYKSTNAAHERLGYQVRQLAYPAGGVVSTATDLLSFGESYIWPVEGFLDRRSLGIYSEPATHGLAGIRAPTQGSSETERTLGWALGGPGALRSSKMLWHSGASGTCLWVDPIRQVSVVWLSATWYPTSEMLGNIVDRAFEFAKALT